MIRGDSFDGIDRARIGSSLRLPRIASEGLRNTFDRGYSEITFAQIAATPAPRSHHSTKEYHLSSADPNLVGLGKQLTIGRTNYERSRSTVQPGHGSDTSQGGAHHYARPAFRLPYQECLEPHHARHPDSQTTAARKALRRVSRGRKDVFGWEVFDQEMLGDVGLRHRNHNCSIQLKLMFGDKDSDAKASPYYASGSRKMIQPRAR